MEDSWIENSLSYLNNRPVGLAKVHVFISSSMAVNSNGSLTMCVGIDRLQ